MEKLFSKIFGDEKIGLTYSDDLDNVFKKIKKYSERSDN